MLRMIVMLSLILFAGLAVAEDAKPGEAKATPYPLDTCIVSGEKLGEMGEPVVKVIDGREVKFCCNGCIKKFNKDPAKFFATIDQGEKDKAAGKLPVNPASPKPVADEKQKADGQHGHGHEGHGH